MTSWLSDAISMNEGSIAILLKRITAFLAEIHSRITRPWLCRRALTHHITDKQQLRSKRCWVNHPFTVRLSVMKQIMARHFSFTQSERYSEKVGTDEENPFSLIVFLIHCYHEKTLRWDNTAVTPSIWFILMKHSACETPNPSLSDSIKVSKASAREPGLEKKCCWEYPLLKEQ